MHRPDLAVRKPPEFWWTFYAMNGGEVRIRDVRATSKEDALVRILKACYERNAPLPEWVEIVIGTGPHGDPLGWMAP